MLTNSQRDLFAALSVFVGGFELAGAEAVCDPQHGSDPLEGVSSLIEKSLLAQQESTGAEPRF